MVSKPQCELCEAGPVREPQNDPHSAGGLLVTGTTSDAGKSTVVAALCRWLARQGLRVAPFKAQNMSNNSIVCSDGAEIGRAQWLQAIAAGAEPESAMSPVLLKPGSDRRSHVVLRGAPWGELRSGEWAAGRAALADAAVDALAELRQRYDVVICEGAGSPAEINLREGDYVNMGLARRADLPVVVVGDIDRGGVFAAMAGTLALLEPADQAHLAAFLVNKFRGDVDLLRPGLDSLSEITGRPVLGVLPWLAQAWLDSEDTLALGGWSDTTTDTLRVAVVRFPRIANANDMDALAAEPGVTVEFTSDPDAIINADIAVLPGTRATVDDLAWLRACGIDGALRKRHAHSRPVLGISSGYQMLATSITTDNVSGPHTVAGLGLLPQTVRLAVTQTVARPRGNWRGNNVTGYEIHHGRPAPPDESFERFLDGYHHNGLWTTMWHGIFEDDGFRRSWLVDVAAQAGCGWSPDAGPGFAAQREDMLNRFADAVAEHVDTNALWQLIEHGTPGGLPPVRLRLGNNEDAIAVDESVPSEANNER